MDSKDMTKKEENAMLDEFEKFIDSEYFTKNMPTRMALSAFEWAWKASKKSSKESENE